MIVTDTAPWRQVLESAFAAYGLPAEVDATVELPTTAFGGALLALLRFAWFDGDRADLFRYLRSPFSGVLRRTVDHAEGRLRGRGMITGEHVRATLRELEYDRLLAAVDELEGDGDPLDQVERRVRRMSAAAAGLDRARVLPDPERRHMAAVRTVERSVLELRELARRGLAPLDRAALVRSPPAAGRSHRAATWRAGRLAVLDLRRVRTRRFQAAFVLGLEEGRLPRGGREDAFLRPRPGGRARAPPARSGRARPAPLLHGGHPALAAAVPVAPGGGRGGAAARALAVCRRGARRRSAAPTPCPGGAARWAT